MELKQLEYFVAAAEELNFTRAAKRCHVVQSAVSASIKALEAELGTDLFDRTTHRVRLTDDGETLHVRARDVLRSADIARSSVSSQGSALRGRLAIGVMQGAWEGMPQAIGRMKSHHPEVRIRLRQAPVTDLFREVLESRLDVAVVPLGRAPVPGLQAQELYRENFVLLKSTGSTNSPSPAVKLAELAEEEFVVFSADWALQAAIDRGFDQVGISPSRSYEVNDVTVGIDIVRAGLAIMIVPRHLAPQLPGVATVELVDPIGWRVGAISSARMCTPAASAFTDIIAAPSRS
jgi:DNA-binding transcriptional LysR family regulator